MLLTWADLWSAFGTGPWLWDDLSTARPFSDVVVDSRQAAQDSLFVALPGEHTDGHLFVADAFRRGAQAALVQRRVDDCPVVIDVQRPLARQFSPAATGEALSLPVCFLVPHTLSALQRLAAYWRRRFAHCRVVGVTGSVGKTTTKELIASVLRQRFATLQSIGNYNNEIGLPLTMLRVHSQVQWVVQEMAMYGLGEIARLAQIAQPEIGVVTNVGPTHLERLGSIERIAQAKSELVQALPMDGLAVLNGDDPRVRAMAGQTKAKRVLYYGLEPPRRAVRPLEGDLQGPAHPVPGRPRPERGEGQDWGDGELGEGHNDLWADELESLGLEGLHLRLHFGEQSLHARLPLLGRHSVYAALAAAAVGLSLGLGWDEVISGLQDKSAQVRLMVVPGVHGVTILDDTYNASPASTVAALNLLSEMDGRKVAVLGGMLELGSYQTEGHQLVGRRAAEVVAVLVTVGELGKSIAEEALAAGMAPERVHAPVDNDEAVAVLLQVLAEGDFVLVKGSRGVAMESIVARLAKGD